MHQTKNIAILGCGWLGIPLAKELISQGYTVKGSTTNTEKIPILKKLGIQPFLLDLNTQGVKGDISGFLKNVQVLIIAVPPKIRTPNAACFYTKIKQLETHFTKNLNVLFISSSSVYSDAQNMPIITKATPVNPQTPSAKALVAIEDMFKDTSVYKTTILRFSGLIGSNRHPVYFLAKKSGIANPDAPINLIHLKDCIGIILRIIATDSWGYTFNAAYTSHPKKKEYYTQKAKDLQLDTPAFLENTISKGKIITSDYLCKCLDYAFTTGI